MSDDPYVKLDPAAKAAWVAALRSGLYKQAEECLFRSRDGSYCCLGVKLRVMGINPSFEGLGSFDLPDWIHSCDMDRSAISHLIRMNDSGRTFAEIADWIDKEL